MTGRHEGVRKRRQVATVGRGTGCERRSRLDDKQRRYASLLLTHLVLAVLLLLPGCGPGRPARVPVSGTITIDGRPLEHGFVRFHPKENRAAQGEVGPGGRFTLTTYEPGDGCVLGKHRVSVIAREILGPAAQRWHAPKKYMRPGTSDLEVEITGPTDDVEISLSWGDQNGPFVETAAGEE